MAPLQTVAHALLVRFASLFIKGLLLGTCVNQNQTGCVPCVAGPEEAGVSGGDVAAAVLVPLILIGLGVAGFFFWKKKGAEMWRKRKANTTQDTEMTGVNKEPAGERETGEAEP